MADEQPLLPRLGFEIELVTPRPLGRYDLARALAGAGAGRVQAGFHLDSEPSLVAGRPVFHHLSRAWEVVDHAGRTRCRVVDDVTIQDDLDRSAPPVAGSWRIVSDEPRLLRLAARVVDPDAPVDRLLDPVAALYGTTPTARADGRIRLDDGSGATLAMVVPQGGERERVAELVTPPIGGDHERRLDELLAPARALGCTVPVEAAVHVHLDAEPFRNAPALAALVRCFGHHRTDLWRDLGTNQRCRRLGPVDDEVLALVARPGFEALSWPEVEAALAPLPLSKYRDVNLVNLRDRTPGKDTVEVRILPGSCDAAEIIGLVRVLGRYLGWSR